MVPSMSATELLLLLFAVTVYFSQGLVCVVTLTQTVHYIHVTSVIGTVMKICVQSLIYIYIDI